MISDSLSTIIRSASVNGLLELYAAILDELRERKIVRSSNAPLGDYTELLFSMAFGWKLEENAASGHDATDNEGLRYQIKGRRLTAKSRQLGFIRDLPGKKFDFLAAALFNPDFSVTRAALIPHALIEPRSRHSRNVNAWIFKLDDGVWALPEVRDVTNELRAAAVTLSAHRGIAVSQTSSSSRLG
jgi:hypothetical protein